MICNVALAVEHASAGYLGRPVLHDVSLTIASGECVAIMGRSGAGKSTLLGLLYDQVPQSVALVPQAAALVKTLSVFHNVYMGRLDRHSTAYNLRNLVWPRGDELEQVSSVLADVGLSEKLREQAGALSGGQQQRVSVARALYNGRPILIGDEPVSALDGVQGADVLRLLRSRFQTLVLALHDVSLALEHADRIIVLEGGRKIIDERASTLTARDLIAHFGGAAP
jgi:phosphonate transport system ATP-binding protein